MLRLVLHWSTIRATPASPMIGRGGTILSAAAGGLPMKIAAVLTVFALVATPAAAQTLTPPQQYARDVYKEIIEFNSVNIGGGTTEVANALAKRFRDAGFADQDIFLGGIQPNKDNVVVRYRGKGGANSPKPLLLL